MENQKYLIIIPVYNEEKNVGQVLDKIIKLDLPCDIAVVDDGSQDNTKNVVKLKNVKLLSHAVNLGYGAALHTGFLYAKNYNYEAVITMDGDGQHEPSEIKKLIQEYEIYTADIIIGSRFFKGSSYQVKFFRNIGRILFSLVTFLITKRKIKDITSGFQILDSKAAGFLAKSDFPLDYPDANMLILLELCGFRIKEIPVKMYPAPSKASIHYGLAPLFYIYKMLLSIFIILLNKNVNKLNRRKREYEK